VRSLDDPAVAKQYTQHTATTTVARFAPSGFYIASGDVSGVVRVWDAAGAEQTKGEYSIIAGRINDIAWDGDSQRIIAVGDGKERFGHCITADSGNSVGEISGHNKQINCVSIRQQRPLRAATGGDDTTLCFFHGAPFKFNTSARAQHDKFIYGTQFSPDGNHLVTVGADRKIWLYDGKTGEAVKQIGEGEHTGSIFGVSWSKDSKRLVTCSGDQTVKIWDAEIGKSVQSWRFGPEGTTSISDQQVGVTWPARSDGLIISVDLEGNLKYLQEGAASPVKVVSGNQKAVTATNYSAETNTFWTGSYEGRLRAWDVSTGLADIIQGEAHSNYVSGIVQWPSDKVATVGWDDTIRHISSSQKTFSGSAARTDGQPKGAALVDLNGKPHTAVAIASGVAIYTSAGEVAAQRKLSSSPTAIAAHGTLIATGADDKTVSIFAAGSNGAATVLKDANAAISTLAFSPTGTHLAAGCTNGKIFVYARGGNGISSGEDEWKLETNRWSAHTARVTSIAWSPNGKNAVSGGLDTNLCVWSLADPGKRIRVANAHKDGIGGVAWVDKEKVVSAGADAAVKTWKVQGLV
jgi:WD40 repeat protein